MNTQEKHMELLIKKNVNFLLPEVKVEDFISYMDLFNSIEVFREQNGGLWVGGKCEVYSDRILVIPNSLNKFVHKEVEGISLDLKDLENIELQKGFMTSILKLKFIMIEIKIRCYGASNFKNQILNLCKND